MSRSNHCHPNTFQASNPALNTESDVERRLQALAAKDGIRVQEFFIDFDKLRKGTVGEAAVSYNFFFLKYFSSAPVLEPWTSPWLRLKSKSWSIVTALVMAPAWLTTLRSFKS